MEDCWLKAQGMNQADPVEPQGFGQRLHLKASGYPPPGGTKPCKVLYLSTLRSEELLPLQAAGAQVWQISIRPKNLNLRQLLNLPQRLRNAIRQCRPDIILLESFSIIGLMSTILSHRQGKPVAVRLKGDHREYFSPPENEMPWKNRFWYYLNRFGAISCLRRAEAILPVSRLLEDQIKTDFTPPSKIIRYVPLSVREQFLAGPDVKKPDNDESWKILSVTNFKYRKKVKPLFMVVPEISRVINERPEITFQIAGNGYFLDSLAQFVKNGQYAGINLLGYCPDVFRLYQEARIFLHFSLLDGLPNAMLEAFAQGLPVIMNSDCPAREFVLPDVNGYLVDLGQKDQLYEVIRKLTQNPEKLQGLGENARKMVRENFSTLAVGESLLRVLDEVVKTYVAN